MYILTIITPIVDTQSGPYPDYSFFFAILPTLRADVAEGIVTTFGFTECQSPCLLADPVYHRHDPPPSAVSEPAMTWVLALILVGLVFLRRVRTACRTT